MKYFDEDEETEPEGMIWRGCLVVKGATHARLSNISLGGLFFLYSEFAKQNPYASL
jgi:hypothetical protein